MREISANALNIEGQPMFKVLDKARRLEAAGRSIIHLEIGDPDFSTPPNIVDAAKRALDAGEHHYTSSWGIPEFRNEIRNVTKNSRGFYPDENQVLVVPGANIGIFYAIFCLCNPGQEVLVPDPGFPTYLSSIKMCGAKAVPYPLHDENQFRIRAADIEPLITPNTRLLILNSPQNPTGAITERWALEEIYELAVKHDLYVYSDEIYARMVYDDSSFFSIASMDQAKERVILSNGFSKAFAMTGWRLGVLVAPEVVAERMMLLLQTTSSCVSPFLQRAGLEAINGDGLAAGNAPRKKPSDSRGSIGSKPETGKPAVDWAPAQRGAGTVGVSMTTQAKAPAAAPAPAPTSAPAPAAEAPAAEAAAPEEVAATSADDELDALLASLGDPPAAAPAAAAADEPAAAPAAVEAEPEMDPDLEALLASLN